MSDKNELRDIEALIADFQSFGMQELHLRANGVEVYLSSDGQASGLDAAPAAPVAGTAAKAGPAPVAPAPAAASAPSAAQAPAAAAIPEGATVIRAPYLGTFYRSPKPGAPRYVELGAEVGPDTDLCLVEVMKLFTAVRAGITGKVSAILAEDGQMVQAGQPLFAIEASA